MSAVEKSDDPWYLDPARRKVKLLSDSVVIREYNVTVSPSALTMATSLDLRVTLS